MLRAGGQKPGFYAFLLTFTKYYCKNPVSWFSHGWSETGFLCVFADFNASSLQKPGFFGFDA
jgi:hypothetical protein